MFLFHLHLSDGAFFQYFQLLGILNFSEGSDSFLIWQFYTFRFLSFSTSYYDHAISCHTKDSLYTLFVYSDCSYQSLKFYFILC